ncbi:hypothetical protein [Streptomyces wuyuanensis]|uniref:hypothetical protein n=1 Tax=Streptomyces wuyuanensis TaxID=1196353 RepID=UPI0034485C76
MKIPPRLLEPQWDCIYTREALGQLMTANSVYDLPVIVNQMSEPDCYAELFSEMCLAGLWSSGPANHVDMKDLWWNFLLAPGSVSPDQLCISLASNLPDRYEITGEWDRQLHQELMQVFELRLQELEREMLEANRAQQISPIPPCSSGQGAPSPNSPQWERTELFGGYTYHATLINHALTIYENGIRQAKNAFGGGRLGSGFYTHMNPDSAAAYVRLTEATLKFEILPSQGARVPQDLYLGNEKDIDYITGNDFLTPAEDPSELKFHNGDKLKLVGVIDVAFDGRLCTPEEWYKSWKF